MPSSPDQENREEPSMPTLTRRATLALTAAVTLAPKVRAQQPSEVKIAMLVPLTGPWARSGLLEKLGAEMAIDDINSAGGIKALGGARLKLMQFDAGDSPDKAKDAAQRMIAQNPDLIGGFGCWSSSLTLAATEVTERAALPWLTLSYSDLITGRGFSHVSKPPPPATSQPQPLRQTSGDRATRPPGKNPVKRAIMGDNTAANVAFFNDLRSHTLKENGLTAAVDEIFTP